MYKINPIGNDIYLLWITQHSHYSSVYCILIFHSGCSSCHQNNSICIHSPCKDLFKQNVGTGIIFKEVRNASVNSTNFFLTNLYEILVNCKLVQCQSPSFVTAKHIHPCHFFNCCHSFSDSSLHIH